MAQKSYVKVLHTGFQQMGAPTNSGLTLGGMFAEWPEDRLLQVIMRTHESVEVPRNAVVAPLSVAPLDGFVRGVLGRHVPRGAIDGLNHAIDRRGRQQSLRDRARNAASVVNDLGPVRLNSAVVSVTSPFAPQVVHSLLGGVRAMRLALRISRYHGVPISPHFMDDWPSTLYGSGQLWGMARREARGLLTMILERSPVLFVIGEDMANEYEARYGRPAVIVGNSTAFADQPHARRPVALDGLTGGPKKRLIYVGGLHLDRDIQVSRIAAGLQRVEIPWVLELFVPDSDAGSALRLSSSFTNVVHSGSLRPSKVPAALADADALLFLESDDVGVTPFTRLSVSTKVPQYLASGRPIMAVGPPEQGSMRAIRDSARSVCLSPDEVGNRLFDAMKQLDSLSHNIRPLPARLVNIFDESETRKRLRDGLTESVLRWNGG